MKESTLSQNRQKSKFVNEKTSAFHTKEWTSRIYGSDNMTCWDMNKICSVQWLHLWVLLPAPHAWIGILNTLMLMLIYTLMDPKKIDIRFCTGPISCDTGLFTRHSDYGYMQEITSIMYWGKGGIRMGKASVHLVNSLKIASHLASDSKNTGKWFWAGQMSWIVIFNIHFYAFFFPSFFLGSSVDLLCQK